MKETKKYSVSELMSQYEAQDKRLENETLNDEIRAETDCCGLLCHECCSCIRWS